MTSAGSSCPSSRGASSSACATPTSTSTGSRRGDRPGAGGGERRRRGFGPARLGITILRYAAALFDLDGTLVDSGKDIVFSMRQALGQVFSEHSLPADDDILALVGLPLEAVVRELGYPADKESTRRFADTYRACYAEHYNDNTRVYPGIKELLALLRAAGVKLALVTTKHQTQAELTLAGSGLAGSFDYVHGWLEGRKHKPDPEPVLAALSRLATEPGSALMVGDSELDIESAKAAGVATCAVTYGFRPAWFLKTYRPDFLVAHPADIAPIVVAQEPGERGQDGRGAGCGH